MNEEQKMAIQEIMESEAAKEIAYISAYPTIPYFLIDKEFTGNIANSFKNEFGEIMNYYAVYHFGNRFVPEGSNGDYIPSLLRYKKAAMILNKEARFFFSNPPSFNVNVDDVTGEFSEENAIIQNYLDKVLELTNFHGNLLKAVKDCFIGKRIAIVVNFTESNKIAIKFLKSTDFLYQYGDDEELEKFIAFYETTGSNQLTEQRWFRKSYVKEKGVVYLTEDIWDGAGELIETVCKKKQIALSEIPAVVITNDGLLGNTRGVSELTYNMDYEAYYSKLANSDMDAERKSMHPIRYTIDASEKSTRNLPTSPGSYWDLQTDEEKPNEGSYVAKVGTIEAQMNYSNPLKVTLDRIENEMYAELDVPNITSEQLAGVITSGKTIQALYWGLTVRCDEKMLAWAYGLRTIAYIIIEGGKVYRNCIKRYTDAESIPDIPYDVLVENNYPIPEDEKEEKELDITEIEAKVLSRKAYLKKWRKLNDKEAASELEQIKLESEMLDNTYLNYTTSDSVSKADQDEQEAMDNVDEQFEKDTPNYTVLQEGQSANARNVNG